MLDKVILTCGVVIGLQISLTFLFKSQKLSKAHNLHLPRRFQHMATGVIILSLTFSFDEKLHTILLGIPAVLFFLFDYIRRKVSDRLNNIIVRNFSQLLRPEEIVNRPMGAVMFLLGLFAAFLITSRPEIRTISILYLSLIDPTASIAGIMIPSPKIYMNKTISGCASSALIALLCTLTTNALHINKIPVLQGVIFGVLSELLALP